MIKNGSEPIARRRRTLTLALTLAGIWSCASCEDLEIKIPRSGSNEANGYFKLDYHPPYGIPPPFFTVPARASVINFQGLPGTKYHFELIYIDKTICNLVWKHTVYTSPGPPTNLTVEQGCNKISIAWSPPARGGYTGFRFEVRAAVWTSLPHKSPWSAKRYGDPKKRFEADGGRTSVKRKLLIVRNIIVKGSGHNWTKVLKKLNPGTYELCAFTVLDGKESDSYASMSFTSKNIRSSSVSDFSRMVDSSERRVVKIPPLNMNNDMVYQLLRNIGKRLVADSQSTDNKPVDRSETVCRPTLTVVRGGSACAGQTIFEDHFDFLREEFWQIEQYIPVYHPEYPFNSYQRLTNQPTVFTSHGYLRIAPTLQQNLQGFTNESVYGILNLFNGCNAPVDACVCSASGADIIPPVVSGRVISNFAFTYGIVEVRAKLPQGDWLYPEILLEPLFKKYGQQFASGVLKIATARGNRYLKLGSRDYSNRVLYGGPIMDFQCRDSLLTSIARTDGELWGDEFHVYSVLWSPDHIILSVDGDEWARVEPGEIGLANKLPKECHQLPRTLLDMGTRIAPFDAYFHLTLGVAAGSITEFPDGVSTIAGRPKPWLNHGRKAKLYFWEGMDAWWKTWSSPELKVDYIKVVAL